jgi:hypothetical protein
MGGQGREGEEWEKGSLKMERAMVLIGGSIYGCTPHLLNPARPNAPLLYGSMREVAPGCKQGEPRVRAACTKMD